MTSKNNPNAAVFAADDVKLNSSWNPSDDDDDDDDGNGNYNHNEEEDKDGMDQQSSSSSYSSANSCEENEEEEEYDRFCQEDNERNSTVSFSYLLRRCLTKIPHLGSAIVSGLGAAVALYLMTPPPSGAATGRRQQHRKRQKVVDVWIDILSFAIYGGLVASPISTRWHSFLKEHGPESPTTHVLVDQLLVQPPRIFLTMMILNVIRATLKQVPGAWREAGRNCGEMIAASWAFWPAATYLILRYCSKNRNRIKHGASASLFPRNICVMIWMAYLARKRAALSASSSS